MNRLMALAAVDRLLADLSALSGEIARIEAAIAAEVAKVTKPYESRLSGCHDKFRATEIELRKVLKQNKAFVFDKRDRIDLDHGAVLRQVSRRVKRVRGMLENLKARGLTDAIRVVESVKWDELEKWPEATLQGLGTERKEKESYGYELKGSP